MGEIKTAWDPRGRSLRKGSGPPKRRILERIKNRLVTFRVTDEELSQLKTTSREQGARCLSEFARAVLLGTLHEAGIGDPREGQVKQKMEALDSRLAAVESDIARVMNLLSLAGQVERINR